jgi:predicted transcriptional regulator
VIKLSRISSIANEFGEMKETIKAAFKATKEELDIHLDSINRNTNEIHGNYEYLAELEAKIDKLSDKVDELQMQVNPHFYTFDPNIKLSSREQEVFMALYTSDGRVTANDVARQLSLTEEIVERIVGNIAAKDVPIVKHVLGDEVFLSIEYHFKDLQARKNILQIDTAMPRTV